ncbi:uncharacterized protein LOC130752712 [Actinidia eriantha]|uniref:uncharacterized protein LOC130752712 n=1 Tax=Actinidia eriantha TaxID=165200 RepID=UPI00258E3C62|nr:uncharacterized protein LOC130752712 [Actinidia eriantha]
MTCFVPFNNRNLDTSFFAFRPMVVLVDELVEALKHFSLCTETLGCVHSAIFRSIHGNMIIWYGAWMKKSNEPKELLKATIITMLENVSTMAMLIDHSFFDAYAGESRDGSLAAKFSTGDIVSMNAVVPTNEGIYDFSYACLALFRSYFINMDGAKAGVCLKCQNQPRIVNLFVWRSLQSCYSWILTTDYRKTVLPYLEDYHLEVKYDIFRVVYVSSDNVVNFQSTPHQMYENLREGNEGNKVMLD